MRIFRLVSLVLVLLIVGLMVQRQASVQATSTASGNGAISPPSHATVRILQAQHDIQSSLDAAMHASRDVSRES